MSMWSRLFGRRTAASVARATSDLTLDEWAGHFSFNGIDYPILNTRGPTFDEEQIVANLEAAYTANGIVFALVLARMQVFSQIRFRWRGASGKLFGSPRDEGLALLRRPWRGGTTSDLLARMELDVSTAGNAYIRKVRRGRTQLVRLPPEHVTIVLGSEEETDNPADAADVEVVGYLYAPPGVKPVLLLPDEGEIAHYAPIPDSRYRFLGMSWISTVLADVRADSAQTLHKEAFLRNAATPNLAIKFDASKTMQQVKEFKELIEAKHTGVANAYRTLYLGGGADATVLGKDFRELDFAATQGKGESRIASAAGVPPSWVSFSEGLQGSSLNAGNFNSARRRFSDGTLQHLWTSAAAALESLVRPPDGAELWFDTTGIPFLAENALDVAEIQAKQASAVRVLLDAGFAPDAAIAFVTANDLGALRGQHSGLFSVQLQPPGTTATPAAPAADTDEGDTSP